MGIDRIDNALRSLNDHCLLESYGTPDVYRELSLAYDDRLHVGRIWLRQEQPLKVDVIEIGQEEGKP